MPKQPTAIPAMAPTESSKAEERLLFKTEGAMSLELDGMTDGILDGMMNGLRVETLGRKVN